MIMVSTGLEKLCHDVTIQNKIKGNIGYLCHTASVDRYFEFGPTLIQKIFGKRLIKLFGPQHGLVTDVQDNMVESVDFIHPYYKIPVHSLYSKTRIPTEDMLKNIDSFIVDLQDVGTRVYTYIWTLTHIMEACKDKDIKIFILDRPNPLGGSKIEGNILNPDFSSFVGRYPIPMVHGLTIGEFALYANKFFNINCNLEIIKMDNWKRDMIFPDTGLPWITPSPNLPSWESALTFPATVLFEGTNISEGRGTTKSLEIIGHPKLDPYTFIEQIAQTLPQYNLRGFKLRPIYFHPMFQKHSNQNCGGIHIHVVNYQEFLPWRLGQFLMYELYDYLKSFKWSKAPYEYEFNKTPIDLINGTDEVRNIIENRNSFNDILKLENNGLDDYTSQRSEITVY